MSKDLPERGNFCTDMHRGRMPCKDEEDWGNASISQGTTKIASKPPEARGEAWNALVLTSLQRNNPAFGL